MLLAIKLVIPIDVAANSVGNILGWLIYMAQKAAARPSLMKTMNIVISAPGFSASANITRHREAIAESKKKDMKMILGLYIRTSCPAMRHAGMSVDANVN